MVFAVSFASFVITTMLQSRSIIGTWLPIVTMIATIEILTQSLRVVSKYIITAKAAMADKLEKSVIRM